MELVKVVSKKDQIINLTKCQLKRLGDTGYATLAELQVLHEYIERVETEPEPVKRGKHGVV